MRKTGKNRASADWFINFASMRKFERGERSSYVHVLIDRSNSRAADPVWKTFAMRDDVFHPAHKYGAKPHA